MSQPTGCQPRRALPPELDPRGGRPAPVRPPDGTPPSPVAAPVPGPVPSQPYGPGGRPSAYAAPPPVPPQPIPSGATPTGRSPRGGLRLRRPRLGRTLAVLVLLVVAFYVGLGLWGRSRITHVAFSSTRAGTPGQTWLLVGSDSREDLTRAQRNELTTGSAAGKRTDTMILMQLPAGGVGKPALVSLPRDSYLPIPGHGSNKLNAAYALGGAPLLVRTVEGATGLTVDHYMEVGFSGIVGVVDAVGGVDVCVPRAMKDAKAGLDVPAGCQSMDGRTSLAYVRARYSDPRGDLGRIERQQQFLAALVAKIASRGTLLNPVRHARLTGAATGAITVSDGTGLLDLARAGRGFRAVTTGGGAIGTVPVADTDYRPGGVGSTVRWDKAEARALFDQLVRGAAPALPTELPSGTR